MTAAMGVSQAFGRFGYSDSWSIPGMVLDREGFKVDYGASDKFRFTKALTKWTPVQTTSMYQLVTAATFAGSPSKLRQDLTASGFSAYFELGFDFRVTSTASPYLSWPDGASLDGTAGVPTPATTWALVSFQDNQPPVLICFPWKKCAVKIFGKPGDWHIASEGPWEGWLRVVAPTGVSPRRTNTVAQLGALSTEVQKAQDALAQTPPELLGLTIDDDESSVTAEWTFDKPGAILPSPLITAPLGGYPLAIQSKTKRLPGQTMDGPIAVTDDTKLVVRFPARRIPTGRILALGNAPQTIGTASFLDPQGVTELALANLFASSEKGLRDLAESTFAEYLSQASYVKEPNTGQQLPYLGDGKGLDLCAAHALLMQSTISVSRASSEENSLLTSLIWRRDWLTWRIWSPDSDSARRASAIGALAAALAPEAQRRLDGAMLEAGLRAEQGARIWRKRNGLEQGGVLLEPLLATRNDIYLPEDYRRTPGLGRVLLSDLRAYGSVPVILRSEQNGLFLTLNLPEKKNEIVTLASSFPIQAEPAGGKATVNVEQGFGLTVLTVIPTQAGEVKIKLTLPSWVTLPPMPAEIRYSETKS